MSNPIDYWYQKYIALKKKMDEMMKEAVEGELFDFWDIKEVEHCIASIDLATTLGFNDGDKVRVIVLPKENEK